MARLVAELGDWMQAQGLASLSEIIGSVEMPEGEAA